MFTSILCEYILKFNSRHYIYTYIVYIYILYITTYTHSYAWRLTCETNFNDTEGERNVGAYIMHETLMQVKKNPKMINVTKNVNVKK